MKITYTKTTHGLPYLRHSHRILSQVNMIRKVDYTDEGLRLSRRKRVSNIDKK